MDISLKNEKSFVDVCNQTLRLLARISCKSNARNDNVVRVDFVFYVIREEGETEKQAIRVNEVSSSGSWKGGR